MKRLAAVREKRRDEGEAMTSVRFALRNLGCVRRQVGEVTMKQTLWQQKHWIEGLGYEIENVIARRYHKGYDETQNCLIKRV